MRFALRTLRRAPMFGLAAILTLAIGIGANTAIFTLVDAILLRPPAHVAAPDRLVAVFTSDFSGPPYGSSSYPDWEVFRAQRDVFADAMLYRPWFVGVGDADRLERAGLELVSANYFSTLGVAMQQGRAFTPEEGAPNGPAVAVIGDALWRRRFGADPRVIGATIRLDGTPFTVVGIAPADFTGAFRGIAADVWVPAATADRLGERLELDGRGQRAWFVVARLAPGVTIEQASARMAVVARQLHSAYPDTWTDVSRQGRRITLVSERDARIPPQVRGPALGFIGLLMGTVALVLLICCANVAGLLLARASGRTREVAIRLALGATRRDIVRQMLAESVLLALIGGAAGALLAVWATHAIAAIPLPVPVHIAFDLSPDVRVLAFTVGVTLATGVIFGLAPALRASRPNVIPALKGEAAALRVGGRRITLMDALVAGQVALSMLLVVGALLFLRTLERAAAIDPGFRADHLLLAAAEPRPDVRGTIDRGAVALEWQRRVAALPGVRAVSWSSHVPLGLDASRRGLQVEGYQPRDGEDMEFHFGVVGPRYFETMQVPLVRGRGFTETDRAGAPGVVVVNQAFAERFWPGESAIGKRITVGDASLEVVGIARDTKVLSLAEARRPYIYYPALQMPDQVILHVRTTGDPLAMTAAVRRELEAAAPDWQIRDTHTMESQVASSLLPQRVAGAVLALFGGVALLLASVGLYGVIAFAVARRTREIGVRVALGADRRDVLALVLRQAMSLVLAGLVVGLPLAWAASRLLGGLLLGGAADPLPFIGAAALLAAVALAATWVPARRAMAVDPVAAMRTD